jgi:hypothetical protein
VHKDLAASALDQRPKTLSHSPAYIAKDLEPLGPRHEKSDAVVAQHTNDIRKAIKCLQLKAGQVKALELFFRKHEVFSQFRKQL